jgi:adenine-specific DNA-methyltransferase
MRRRGRKDRERGKQVEVLTHDEARRRNIPTAEMQSLYEREAAAKPVTLSYPRATPLAPGQRRARNPDLDPQLVWRGKDEQDWSDLVVHAPPLYIQEKIHPKVIIEDLRREAKRRRDEADDAPDLFADFNGLPDPEAKLEFYQHDQNWSNRMILGDSLQVMASLAEREGLRGQVQCIYIDPPYGIRFNSNWQVSTRSRDVRDGKVDHITREPEQVKAFRDTWKHGIHSYLTYLRDRLTVARDLLHESGSIFVQIGDENVHRVRALMAEVFGDENLVAEILVKKKGSQKSSMIDPVNDYILWFSKTHRGTGQLKFHSLYEQRGLDAETVDEFSLAELPDGRIVNLKKYTDERGEKLDFRAYPRRIEEEFPGASLLRPWPITNGGERARQMDPVKLEGEAISPPKGRCWSHTSQAAESGLSGMERNLAAGRLIKSKTSLDFKRYLKDFPYKSISNWWDGLGGASDQSYIVQTNERIVERCILMVSDPGDLVLDPTCGSGTTAYVAEQWGRRWITIDTSRVALALTRARIMGARYPYYLLADSEDGRRREGEITKRPPADGPTYGDIRQGFVYRRCAYVTSGRIANNAEIDVIREKWQETLEPLRTALNEALGESWEEWQIPRDAKESWPPNFKDLHARSWEARVARQKEIDESIARAADVELLYDKPYEDRSKVRVAGPFTVESLSPHRVIPSDEYEASEEIEAADGSRRRRSRLPYQREGETDFAEIVIEHLRTAGVQQRHKEDRITFTSLAPWPGEYVGAEGRFMEREQEKRAAILIGPEYGTISRPDLIAAAREAAEAGFDLLIACGFAYDAHASEFSRLGPLPVLRARMNPDLHMADELKNTGAGNLFVVFGEPDVEVVSGQWLVTSGGRMVVAHERLAQLPGLGSLEAINRLGGSDLPRLKRLALGREVRPDRSDPAGGGLGAGERRGGGGPSGDGGAPPVSERREGFSGGGRDASDPGGAVGLSGGAGERDVAGVGGGDRAHALRPDEVAAIEELKPGDFPLQLTTDHYAQVTIHGVDVFDPQTGEVRSGGTDDIAAWFVDTDYDEESFFVRHAYFLGAHDPYKALKTTLKAEIDEEAWATLYRDVSRPFPKPSTGRFAVKVINHLGDEVMKVFQV